jgi:hypothetical protein
MRPRLTLEHCVAFADFCQTEGQLNSYCIRALNSSGLTAMTNAIMSPSANPMSVPAATPRQSTFCSLGVTSTSTSHSLGSQIRSLKGQRHE